MSYVSKVAQVVGAKTARACDGCIRKRARWFCAADDAFLCQSCDSKIHSANPVSRRHERVRLKTASFQSQTDEGREKETPRGTRSVSSWHNRKARTPRRKLQCSSGFKKSPTTSEDDVVRDLLYLVPEVMSDETTSFNGQPLLYGRVRPIVSDSKWESKATSYCFGANEVKGFVGKFYNEAGFVPSETDLEEFAADVESLLGKGLDNDESFGIDGLGLMMEVDESSIMEVDGSSMIMDDTTSMRCSGGRVMIKDEDEEEEEEEEEEIEMANEEVFDLCFDYDEEEEIDEKIEVVIDDDDVSSKKRKILLRLDYESILSAWDGASPWDFDPNDQCWPICKAATCQIESHQLQLADHATSLNSQILLSGDGGREARVSRYREKRRTRLFSKKIRYEVRKLNAEKRPRMKGRFVKRSLPLFPLTSSVS